MDRPTLISWILAAVFAVAALVAVVAQPTHWKRTLVVAVVLAMASAAYALTRGRRAPNA
jgi:hypothetical protein